MNSEFLKYLTIPFSKPLYDSLVGSYQTKIKGQGTDYESSRIYDTSDHPKYIDWKTTAKKDTLYTKQYHEEQQLHLCFLLDIGNSMQFGFQDHTKYDSMRNIALLLGSLISEHQDSCSIICFDQKIESIETHLQGPQIIPTMIRIFENYKNAMTSGNELHSNLSHCLSRLPALITHPSHYIILSDDEDPALSTQFQAITQQHDISYIHITHRLEDQGITQTSIPLSDGKTSTHGSNNLFATQRQQQLEDWKISLKRLGIHYLHINEHSDIFKSLGHLWK